MKTLKFLLTLVLIGAISFSCKKTEQEPNIQPTDGTDIQKPALDVDKVNQRINDRLALIHDYREQLALEGNANRDCMPKVIVPDDVSSIQDAIEMVCDHGQIIVKSGTYTESLYISNKPGIHLRTNGNVILNGDIAITDNSDNVTIEGFNIIVPDYPFPIDVVLLYYVSGCVIKDNIISNQAYPGIESEDYGITLWEDANDNHIKDNQVSEMFCGIILGNLSFDYTTSDNMVKGNLVSYTERAIWLIFDCDNNKIMANQINNSLGPVSIGISMTGIDFFGLQFFVENNEIKQNDVSYCDLDGLTLNTAFDNMIGPINTFNYNGRDGMVLMPYTEGNNVINNEALYNAGFDIWNGGVNNKFRANTAGTTFGL